MKNKISKRIMSIFLVITISLTFLGGVPISVSAQTANDFETQTGNLTDEVQ